MRKIHSIKMIYTGGTIGMKSTADGLLPDADAIERFLLSRFSNQKIMLYTDEPLIDSSALDFNCWNRWIELINRDLEKYQGVIILHGTDTLAYTAAMLSILYSNSTIPIILTGAMEPINSPTSDGETNLISACSALESLQEGVFVVFNCKLWAAEDCVKVSTREKNAFCTPHNQALAQYSYKLRRWCYPKGKPRSSMSKVAGLPGPLTKFRNDTRVCTLWVAPGNQWAMSKIIASQLWDAIILQTFGNGNIPVTGALCKELNYHLARGIPILNVTQVLRGRVGGEYGPGKKLLAMGCISGLSATFELVYVVTQLALSLYQHPLEQKSFIQRLLEAMDAGR
ncbi:MAG: asparaginase domain-containing protein [Neisseriaceae bacterium]